ncbi:MAG: C25 family cysteine peptidase [candidate division WOR-3 bacterium]
MKNKDIIIFIILLWTGSLIAKIIRFSDVNAKPGLFLLSQSVSGVELEFNMPSVRIEDADINGEVMQVVSSPGILLFFGKEGAPNTPGLSRYIAIPKGSVAKVRIIEEKKEIFRDINLIPMHNIPLENDNSPLRYEKDMSIYSKDAYYPETPVLLSEPMKIRELDVVILNITPFQYNPVKKELVVYKKLRVKVDFIGGNGQFGDDAYRSRFWEPLLWGHIINYATLPKIDFSDPSRYRGTGYEYIIITRDDPVFKAWADSIKRWRTLEGIKTGVFTVTQIGGNTVQAIETFIDTAYQNWQVKPIAFLIVGDYPNPIPAVRPHPYEGTYCTDNVYAAIGTTDFLPDLYSARIFADSESHLQLMINKILEYEKTPPMDFNFYNEPLIACGWQTERWFQLCTEIIRRFLISVKNKSPKRAYKIYSGTPIVGGPWSTAANTNLIVDYFGPYGVEYIPETNDKDANWWNSGNVDSINIRINSGAFIVHHRDHGSEYGWGEPAYNILNLSGLNNDKYPLVFSINCLTGKYNHTSQCFLEAFLRYPKRAVGANGATQVSYSFVNDTYIWGYFDAFYPEFMPDYPILDGIPSEPPYRNSRPSFAITYGKYFLHVSNWPSTPEVKEVTYGLFHFFGDAFQYMYTEVPKNLNVNHAYYLLPGATQFEINAEDSSWISLTKKDQNGEIVIIGVGEGTGYPITINIEPQFPPETIIVTVTKHNCLRYVAYVPVVDFSTLPQIPTIISPFNFARFSTLNPTLKFYSTDPQGEQISYKIKWSLNPNFTNSDSFITISYPSGEIVSFNFPYNLIAGKTYWWKVNCKDPQGSNQWTPYSEIRSFTVGENIPENTSSWYQTTGDQFRYNTLEGVKIEGDSVLLVPSSIKVCTLLAEKFESGIPQTWTVIDGNNDGIKWEAGTTSSLSGYEPPYYQTKYAYYSDAQAGNGTINYNEELISPKIGIPSTSVNLKLKYTYGFKIFENGEKYRIQIRKKVNSLWSEWITVKMYTTTCNGSQLIDLTEHIPCDSIQLRFFYSDSTSTFHWGYACGIDNIHLICSYQILNNFGIMITPAILYSELSKTYERNKWGDIIVYKRNPDDSIGIQIEYFDGESWILIPDSLLPNNSIGIYKDTLSISHLDTLNYGKVRIKVLFYKKQNNTPCLLGLEAGNLSEYVNIEEKSLKLYIPYIKVSTNIFEKDILIKYTFPQNYEKINLSIFDSGGRMIKDLTKEIIKTKSSSLRIGEDFSKGIYFIKFETNDYKKILKIIKIR